MTRYRIRRISPLPAFKFGLLIGGPILLLPGFLAGLVLWGVAQGVRLWLESWDSVSLAGITEISFLNILELTDLLEIVQWLDGLGWLLVAATTLGAFFLGGFVVGFFVALSAAFYNVLAGTGGGLEIMLEGVGRRTEI